MRIDFNASEGPSLGVEVELSVVDRDTRGLTTAASDLLAVLGAPHPDGTHPKAKHELFECTVEVITGICGTVAEARADLEATIAELAREVDPRGLGLLCSGTHPFSEWADQKVSPGDRYANLVEELQWPARRLAIFGIHYHVGVPSGERAVALVNSLAFLLPVFLALSASSPYWHGHDTGMASVRTKIFESLPRAGLPPRLSDWTDFEEYMATLMTAEAIRSIREVWWDVRPHPDFGTVELRMCDGMPTMREISALAALAQSLVVTLAERHERGEELPHAREWVIRQNKWLAARYGLDGLLIVDSQGGRRPAREVVELVLDLVRPAARRLGCAEELDDIRLILERGASAARQRRVVAEGGTFEDVVDLLLDELVHDELRP